MNGTDKATVTNTPAADSSQLPLLLACLLVVQIGLALLLRANAVQYKSAANEADIIPVSLGQVGKIVITNNPHGGKKTTSLSLAFHNNAWDLPDQYGFPAATRSVNALTEDLHNLKKDFPVATTPDAAERFKVTADTCDHSITLSNSAKELGTLFIGSAAGTKNVNVRWSGNNDIYSVEFPQDMLSTDPANWWDSVRLSFANKDVVGLEFPDFKMTLAGTGWTMSAGGKDQPMVPETKDWVVNKLTNIDFKSVLGKDDRPEFNSSKPGFVYKIFLRENPKVPVIYSFSQTNKGDWVLKKSDLPFYLEANSFWLGNVKTVTAPTVIQANVMAEAKDKWERAQREAAKAQFKNMHQKSGS
ncbi:MAG TPA: DUF4340 domain-containing protein [Planktothrix sp.]